MVELEAFLPLIGLVITGGAVPIVIKKMDLGKKSNNNGNGKAGLEDKLEKLEERVRLTEVDIATLKRRHK